MLSLFPLVPSPLIDASVISPVIRSFTYTSTAASVSPGSRFVAMDSKATVFPSADREGRKL